MSQRFTFLSFYFPGKHHTLLIVLTVILLDNKSRHINFGGKKTLCSFRWVCPPPQTILLLQKEVIIFPQNLSFRLTYRSSASEQHTNILKKRWVKQFSAFIASNLNWCRKWWVNITLRVGLKGDSCSSSRLSDNLFSYKKASDSVECKIPCVPNKMSKKSHKYSLKMP